MVSGSHQDHPQDLDLDQDLLICHLDVADEVKCLMLRVYLLGYQFLCLESILMVFFMQVALQVYWQCAVGLMYNFFNLFIRTFTKSCRLLKSFRVL